MQYTELIILLPCHSLEDFPLHHEGEDAQGLLANWTAMFHPALIAATGKMPQWCRVDDPPEDLEGRLLLVPSVSMSELPAGFASRAKNEGGLVIRRGDDRAEIVTEALAALDEPPTVEDELVADFHAVGYCYLQVELLTRQMRYASNLDEVYFNNQLVAAAQAAVSGDTEKARELLASCFDVLGEERDHFYPVDAFILDLTLVADTTLGQSLRDELARPEPLSLLISGGVVEQMASAEPESLAAMKQGLAENKISLVGGEYDEGPTTLLGHEALFDQLTRGGQAYEAYLGGRPTVFGRRRFGLSPLWPGLLSSLGFKGALHTTFDGGQFPDGAHIKTMWEGVDGAAIDCLARPPLDATQPETFLTFCMKMGESMDSDQVATVCFAHWPGQACKWYEDLRRCARWGPALGKFITLEEYFASTDEGGMHDAFDADQYRTPYLKQAVIREQEGPLAAFVEHYENESSAFSASSLDTLTSLLSGDASRSRSHQTLDESHTDQTLASSATAFASALPRGGGQPEQGVLVANPHSFVRRVLVEANDLPRLPKAEKPIYAAAESAGTKRVVVDVPPMGFVWVTGSSDTAADQKPLVEDGVLRNEYFEVRLDETTGSIRSLHDYKDRKNRLSQRLALWMPPERGAPGDAWSDPEQSASYSVMAADSIETKTADATLGEVITRGRLLDTSGERLADFEQTYRITRGSRVLQIDVRIDPAEPLRADPWNSYVACRFAWADESANVFRTVGGIRRHTASRRLESPLYVDLDLPKDQRIAVLTGGLPFHRLVGYKMLDTLLAVRGESRQRFTLGLAIDSQYPLQDALSLLTPPTAVSQQAAPPAGATSGYLFHLDSRNVVATNWSPLVEEGAVVGFRTRLLEAYGRRAKANLSCFKTVSSARLTTLSGEPKEDLEVDGDKIALDIEPCGWVQVEARW